MEEIAGASVRFYYPVRAVRRTVFFIHYAYEMANGEHGVGMYEERGEVLEFASTMQQAAIQLCQFLNAREACLPGYLPKAAEQFLWLYGQAHG